MVYRSHIRTIWCVYRIQIEGRADREQVELLRLQPRNIGGSSLIPTPLSLLAHSACLPVNSVERIPNLPANEQTSAHVAYVQHTCDLVVFEL